MKKPPNGMSLPARPRVVDPTAADRFVSAAAEPAGPVVSPKPPAEPTKRLTLDLPVSLHRKFKTKAVAHDKTMMQFLIEAVEAWTREDG